MPSPIVPHYPRIDLAHCRPWR